MSYTVCSGCGVQMFEILQLSVDIKYSINALENTKNNQITKSTMLLPSTVLLIKHTKYNIDSFYYTKTMTYQDSVFRDVVGKKNIICIKSYSRFRGSRIRFRATKISKVQNTLAPFVCIMTNILHV